MPGLCQVVLLVYYSESTRGEKFDIAKGVAKTVINTLTKQDYVHVICARLMSGCAFGLLQ